MSEYIPKYPSKEGDDSNKTSSELLAETLKPIYVPQDLMLAWESHLASYSRDTNVLLDQVKDSELALNTQYQALLTRVQKYEQMLQDITMDSNEFTMDTDEVNFTGWNILAQASYWDYLLRKEITKLSDQIKSTEYKGGLVTEVTDAVLVGLIADNTYISNVIGALSDTPLIRELDAALTSTVTSITDLQAESVRLAEKQAADAAAFADQQVEMLGQLVTSIEASKAEQLNRLAEEAAIRTQLLQELEAKTDAITADYNAVVDTLHTTVIQELTTMQDGISASVSELKTADEAIITSLDAYKVSNGQNIAALQNSVNVVTNTQESIATQVTGLIASFDQIDLGLSKAQADIITSNQARADGDAALSQQITTINSGLGEANSRIDTVSGSVSTLDSATATKFSQLDTRLGGVDDSIASVRQIADTAVSNDTAQATEINALKSRMTVTEGDVINKADASALSSLNTRVVTVEGNYTSQAADITQLSNSLDTANLNVSNAASAAQNALNTAGSKGKVIFGSDQPGVEDRLSQNLWIDTTGGSNTPKRWNGASWVVVTDKVASDALSAANAASAIVNTKADASALNTLDTKVTNLGEDVVSQGSQVTQLTNTLATLDNRVSSKAESSALNTLDSKVSNIGGKVTANASSITALEGNISTIENGLATKADAEALTSLTTRVSNTEGGITSQGTRVTNLENSVNHETTGLNSKASSSALTSLDNKVTLVDDKVSVTNSSLLSLEGRVATTENGIASKLDASVINGYYTKTESDQATATSITTLRAQLATGARNFVRNTKEPAQGIHWLYQRPLTAKLTGVFTISFDVEALDDTPASGSGAGVGFNKGTGGEGGFNYVWYPNLAMKGHLTHTLTLDSGDFTHFGIYANNTVKITNVMVQRGDVDYPWAAAPEDNEAAIDANAQAIRNTNTEVSRISGVVVAQGTSITNLQADLTTTNNNVATKADGSALTALTTRVSNAEGNIATQSTQVTNLTASLSNLRVGGANLLKNSEGVFTPNTSRRDNYVIYQSSTVDMINGKEYTLSGETNGEWGSEHNTGAETNKAVLWLVGNGIHAIISNSNVGTKGRTFVWDNPSGTYTIRLNSYRVDNSIWFKNIKIESGNKRTDWTPATSDTASAAALSTLDTKVTAVDGRVTTHASSITQLQADVSGNSSKLIVQGDVVNGLKASYVVKTDVNGLVTGYGLYNEGGVGAFGVNADYFYVGKQSANKKPFLVLTSAQTIDGITYPAGTYINTALIANATIGTAKIADAAITNAKILDATIESAKIKSIKADKIEIGNPLVGPITPSMVTGTSLTNAANLFNGNAAANGSYATYGTGTQSATSGAETNYIQVDVGSTVSMPEVRFFFRGSTGRKTYIKLKASVNGSNWDYIMGSAAKWETIEDMPPGPGSSYGTVTVQASFSWYGVKPYRYLRIYGNGSNISSTNELVAIIGNASGTVTKIGSEGILTGSITADKIQVDSLSAISANLGTLTSTSPQGTTTMTGSLIEVQDSSGQLRVKLGVW